MHKQFITSRLTALGVPGMAESFENQMANQIFCDMPFDERINHGILAEEERRKNRQRERLNKSAKFRINASPEAIIYSEERGLQRSQIAELCTCNWIKQGHNIIVTGPTGTGKTYVTCALGQAAVRLGLSVLYHRTNLLLEQMAFAHHDGSIARQRAQLQKADLLILDDMAVAAINDRGKQDLLELLDSRAGQKSTIIAGQRPFGEWYGFLDNPILADAILDRMSQQAYKIAIKGESQRKPI